MSNKFKIVLAIIIAFLLLFCWKVVSKSQPKEVGGLFFDKTYPFLIGGTFIDFEYPKSSKELWYKELEILIPKCENPSGNCKECNHQFGCAGGMGNWQFLWKTWNTTLDRMKEDDAYMPERCWQKVYLPVSKERNEAIFDYECNDLAGKWLLRHDGTSHWGVPPNEQYPNGTWWGSWRCFIKYTQ